MNEKATVTVIAEKSSDRTRAPKKDGSLSRLASKNPVFGLQQTIGNQAMQRLLHSGMIQTKVRDKPQDGKPSDEADCSGWESDPESFSIMAAKMYLRKIWKSGFSVGVVKVTNLSPDWETRVVVHTGAKDAQDIVLKVGLMMSIKSVLIGRGKFDCDFKYHCTASGELVFGGPSMFDCV